MSKANIILVNENDEVTGVGEKYQVHREGLLHQAFSIFIMNSKGELLLQKRAVNKYHSGGLWTNTCCSHTTPGEEMHHTIHKRLMEEMGITCELHWLFSFRYNASVGNGFIENELDHVFLGICDYAPVPDPKEVSDWKWISLPTIEEDLKIDPDKYTYWFRLVFDRFKLSYHNFKSLERGEAGAV